MKFTRQTQCPARVNCIVKTNGKVIVSNVELNHNHSLEPQLSMFIPGNQELSLHMKRLLESRDIAGYRTCKNVRTLEVMAGGPQNLDVTELVCGYRHMTEEFKAFQDMERSFVKCADAAITDPHAIKMVKEAHKKLLVDIMNINRGGLISNPSPNGENARISTDPPTILDPLLMPCFDV
ncbi:hypothetical protein SASPL_135476 [Salvia splendens]|uniref:Protein FAR1-RELATED SEQUENCE n=1 Tax=Salvia splendens TaxID=180675 RepID=A0A8X8ZGN9_SALSN|nr:hypothetical protein SASPL_135476 [Salvia splendens]